MCFVFRKKSPNEQWQYSLTFFHVHVLFLLPLIFFLALWVYVFDLMYRWYWAAKWGISNVAKPYVYVYVFYVFYVFYSCLYDQFIFEAVQGGNEGSIAIDDVMVYRSESDSCPAERECTFQSSLCGFLPEPSTPNTWSRTTAISKPANSSGPNADHTLQTDQGMKVCFSFQSNLMIKSKLLFSNIMRSSMNLSGILRTGYYLSAQLWKHPAGTRVAIMTPVMESTVSDGECLMFWYHMEGNGVGELSVYLQGFDESRRPVSWNRGYNEGKHWRHGRVTLISSVPFQVNSSWSGSSCEFVDKNQNGT